MSSLSLLLVSLSRVSCNPILYNYLLLFWSTSHHSKCRSPHPFNLTTAMPSRPLGWARGYVHHAVISAWKFCASSGTDFFFLPLQQSRPNEVKNAVEVALRSGYRHIDGAAVYDNEKEVGDGIKASGVDRKDIFVGAPDSQKSPLEVCLALLRFED